MGDITGRVVDACRLARTPIVSGALGAQDLTPRRRGHGVEQVRKKGPEFDRALHVDGNSHIWRRAEVSTATLPEPLVCGGETLTGTRRSRRDSDKPFPHEGPRGASRNLGSRQREAQTGPRRSIQVLEGQVDARLHHGSDSPNSPRQSLHARDQGAVVARR